MLTYLALHEVPEQIRPCPVVPQLQMTRHSWIHKKLLSPPRSRRQRLTSSIIVLAVLLMYRAVTRGIMQHLANVAGHHILRRCNPHWHDEVLWYSRQYRHL